MSDLQAAIALARAGKKAEAGELLVQIVHAEPQNIAAWLWLADCHNEDAERMRVLEDCLVHNPDCEAARRGLMILRGRLNPPRVAVSPEEAMPSPAANPLPTAIRPPQGVHPPPRPAALAVVPRPQKISRAAIYLFYAFWVTVLLVAVIGILAILPAPAQGSATQEQLQPRLDPVQTTLTPEQAAEISRNDWGYRWTLTPQAHYRVTARVLSISRYFFDVRARLAPYDLALGWGDLSDPTVDRWITWAQGGRWYYYQWSADSPFSGDYIRDHSANTHTIPANQNIAAALGLLEVNDVVLLEGLLVNSTTTLFGQQWYADTSLSRTDSGDGGCEVLYVERLVWRGKEYK